MPLYALSLPKLAHRMKPNEVISFLKPRVASQEKIDVGMFRIGMFRLHSEVFIM
jgi:hypothetical protein